MPINPFGLPEEELAAIRERDRDCVYCHVTMRPYNSDGPRTAWATIEHFNGPPFDDPSQVAYCCAACNSSRGARTHEEWFATAYCQERGIDASTVAKPVRDYLRIFEVLRAQEPEAVCPTIVVLSTGFDGPITVPEEHPDSIAGAVQRHIRKCDHPWCRDQANR
jgi:hypothetical protein